jgi:tripartite-type tricarboxylate transporter receptor subunit TctC
MNERTQGQSHVARSLLSALAAFAWSGPTLGAEYPNRPVRLVVPFPPGGGASDFQARTLGPKLGEQLRQQIVIDNRPGANGTIGLETVARASADGHTLLLGFMSALTINPVLYSKISYDPVRDFASISMVSRPTLVLVANPSFPANSVKELIALAKATPGKISYGSPGVGNGNHIAGEMLKSIAGIDLVHVPYKGAPLMMVDVMAGQVPIAFVAMATAMPHVRAGKLKALMVISNQRSVVMPEIPTTAELGMSALEQANGWFGILAPARTPKAVISRLNEEIVKVMQPPDIRERFVAQGLEPVTTTPDEFEAVIKSDLVRWAKLIKQAGIRAE